MTIAYIALKYEFQQVKHRPSHMVIADAITPLQNLKIMVRWKILTWVSFSYRQHVDALRFSVVADISFSTWRDCY